MSTVFPSTKTVWGGSLSLYGWPKPCGCDEEFLAWNLPIGDDVFGEGFTGLDECLTCGAVWTAFDIFYSRWRVDEATVVGLDP